MRIAWISDIHLDFLNEETLPAFYDMLAITFTDALLLGGDIGESRTISDFLIQIAQHAQIPVYFVLGNHVYYGSSLHAVRHEIRSLCQQIPHLHYLSEIDKVVPLGESTALIGHDGWADLEYGDFQYSSVWMRDYSEIEELKGHKKKTLPDVMRQFSQQAATHIENMLNIALQDYNTIVILTHVPPFQEACWHEGKISDKEWLPHFTCKAVGDVVKQFSTNHPTKQFRVLCGHTHGSGKAKILPNLRIWTKGAEYGEIRPPFIATFT